MLANDEYSLLIAGGGESYSFAADGQAFSQLADDHRQANGPGRFFYLRDHDSGELWDVTGQLTGTAPDHWQAVHAAGSTRMESGRDRIELAAEVFVPPSDPLEIWQVKITNAGKAKRRLSLYFVIALDDAFTDASFTGNTLFARQFAAPNIVGFLGSDHTIDSFETDAETFFGSEGDWRRPANVVAGRLARSHGPFQSGGVLAAEKKLTLGGGVTFELSLLAGLVQDGRAETKIKHLVERYAKADTRRVALGAVREAVQTLTNRRIMRSPNPVLNRRYNRWSTWQTHQASRQPGLAEARTGRVVDPVTINALAEHTALIAADNPELAKAYAEEICRHQFKDGSVLEFRQQTQTPISLTSTQATIAWLVAATAWLNETGAVAWLKTDQPFADGGRGSIHEHINRAVKFLIERVTRRHLLEDGQESVAATGRLLAAFQELVPVFEHTGDHHQSRQLTALIEELTAAIQKTWTGSSFPRQLTPVKIGVATHKYHQLDLETQLWAIVTGAAGEPRAAKLLNHLTKMLGSQAGVTDFAPAYASFDAYNPFATDRPGTGRNGAITVTHNLLLARACAKTDNPEQLIRLLEHFAGGFLIADRIDARPMIGRVHERWSAASAGWWQRIIIEDVAGITPVIGGLKINPCLPRTWRNFEISRTFRGAEYHFRFYNPLGVTSGLDRVIVDGARLTGALVTPFRTGSHLVEVFLG